MKQVLIFLVKFYQKLISPIKPPTCRFYPSCSTYSLQCYQRFGAWKGTILTVKRIAKCHPFHPGGVDLAPGGDKEDPKEKLT